ncbi:MAG: protein kinase [Lachnospiraceae bacterium]|nr:protein kinase [Lachnospiraceae bacterium]
MLYFKSDRYETVYTVYKSSATKIVLIREKKTDDIFILKRICKDSNLAFPNYFSEADLLQKLNYPTIPKVIDTYEDEKYVYIIEEYVEGESLKQYLQDHQKISRKEFFKLIKELCETFMYLHENPMGKILYLDLKPEHIYVEGSFTKLIDFGNACTESGNLVRQVGTIGYASPEQIKGEQVDGRSDIYAFGQIIKELSGYVDFNLKVVFIPLIWSMTRKDKAKRPENIRIVYDEICRFEKYFKKKEKVISKKIAVVGCDNGVGVTQVAISLVSYLNQAGYRAYYRDEAQGRTLEIMHINHRDWKVKDGIIYHDNFAGIIKMGAAIKEIKSPEGILVEDYGVQLEGIEADATIYVCDNSPWHRSIDKDMLDKTENIVILGNRYTRNQAKELARFCGDRIYRYPGGENPMKVSRKLRLMFMKMLKMGAEL